MSGAESADNRRMNYRWATTPRWVRAVSVGLGAALALNIATPPANDAVAGLGVAIAGAAIGSVIGMLADLIFVRARTALTRAR